VLGMGFASLPDGRNYFEHQGRASPRCFAFFSWPFSMLPPPKRCMAFQTLDDSPTDTGGNFHCDVSARRYVAVRSAMRDSFGLLR
jgi:hypothetical protein